VRAEWWRPVPLTTACACGRSKLQNGLMGATADRLAYPDSAEELMRACWAYAIGHRPLFGAPRQQVVIGLNLHCALAHCKCTVHSSW